MAAAAIMKTIKLLNAYVCFMHDVVGKGGG